MRNSQRQDKFVERNEISSKVQRHQDVLVDGKTATAGTDLMIADEMLLQVPRDCLLEVEQPPAVERLPAK